MFEGLFYLFVFPGLAFQVFCGLAFEWVDRKLLARFQRRVGPQWFDCRLAQADGSQRSSR